MVQVYLPMGYPILQGLEFETVVFQSNLVRLYTVPKDPRSNSSLFHRRFLSDVSKMRSFAGKWARGAMIEALGSHWTTVLFQLIKTDSFSWWTEAGEVWDSFLEQERDAWRTAAPYKVTFNDKGWIFFSLVRVMVQALSHYGLASWKSSLWGAGESDEALEWFTNDYQWAFIENGGAYNHPLINYSGSWILSHWYQNQSQLAMKSSGSLDDQLSAYFYSKKIICVLYTDPNAANVQMFVDGVLHAEGVPGSGVSFTLETTKKRLRSMHLKQTGSGIIMFWGVGM